jgi:hypothetical protein
VPAEHLNVGVARAVISEEVLLVDQLQLITEHHKVVLLNVRYCEGNLLGHRLQHVQKVERLRQNLEEEIVFGRFDRRHKLLVRVEFFRGLICTGGFDRLGVRCHLFLGLFYLFHFLLVNVLDRQPSNNSHDVVEVLLRSLVR